jgi:2-C-methyl-D-erythritol 4-phosphate cytidylyltransferase
MNIAMLIAGGNGQRMNQDIPKQFLNVNDKPVIIYTLEAFQKHQEIDVIMVVCIKGWEAILQAYAKQFRIDKLTWVVEGADTGQTSIYNGIKVLEKKCLPEDIILIHDAIRPMVSEEIITDCIATCKAHGSAITVIPCAEAMLVTKDRQKSDLVMDRNSLVRTQTPQALPLSKLLWAHQEAAKKNITNSVATCTLMVELGETIYFSNGSEKNVKLTTTEDIEIFKALLVSRKDEWLK